MAGFTLKHLQGSKVFLGNIQRNIRYLSTLGMKYQDKLTQQSKSIGIAEAEMDSMYNIYAGANLGASGMDYGNNEFIAFYDKEYPTRRDFLRKFAMNGEIEHVLEVISDESIVFDENKVATIELDCSGIILNGHLKKRFNLVGNAANEKREEFIQQYSCFPVRLK